MCNAIETHPRLPLSQPRITPQPLLPIPGTNGAFGLEYCLQLPELALDIHPGGVPLPPQLGALPTQRFSLSGKVCGAIACGSPERMRALADAAAREIAPIDPFKSYRDKPNPTYYVPPIAETGKNQPRGIVAIPVDQKRIHCFCIELFAVGVMRILNSGGGPRLVMTLEGFEVVDIKPDGLEDSVECLVSATLQLGVLPRIRIALDALTFSLGRYATLTIQPTPISANVPFNPDLSKDRLSVLIDVAVS